MESWSQGRGETKPNKTNRKAGKQTNKQTKNEKKCYCDEENIRNRRLKKERKKERKREMEKRKENGEECMISKMIEQPRKKRNWVKLKEKTKEEGQ